MFAPRPTVAQCQKSVTILHVDESVFVRNIVPQRAGRPGAWWACRKSAMAIGGDAVGENTFGPRLGEFVHELVAGRLSDVMFFISTNCSLQMCETDTGRPPVIAKMGSMLVARPSSVMFREPVLDSIVGVHQIAARDVCGPQLSGGVLHHDERWLAVIFIGPAIVEHR